MGELRSYCTVGFRTQKHLYLSFYSTDFNNFFLIFLAWLLLTVQASFFVLSAVASELGTKKGQNFRVLAPSVDKNDFPVPQV